MKPPLENIPYELHALEAHAPLLLSDQGLKQVGAVDMVLHAMSPMVPKAIFTDIPADSSRCRGQSNCRLL